jgi:uncharacterized lipoprotein
LQRLHLIVLNLHSDFNTQAMTRSIRYLLACLLIGLIFVLGNSACSSADRSMCERDKTFKKSNSQRNRYNYSTRYGNKSKPAKKDYEIRNKRTGKRY